MPEYAPQGGQSSLQDEKCFLRNAKTPSELKDVYPDKKIHIFLSG